MPACWTAILRGGRSEGQEVEWRLESVKGKTSNFGAGEHRVLQEAVCRAE